MEFRLFGYGTVYAGMFRWSYERHAEVLLAWRDWTRTAPHEVQRCPILLGGRSL